MVGRSLKLFNRQLDHAAYLGSEFMRAELALVTGQEYVQD
jgi:dihydropteroate synthase